MSLAFTQAVKLAVEKDPRYQPEAYDLVRHGLHLAIELYQTDESSRHITGQQLLEGFRKHVLQEFGPMSLTILHLWGVREGLDVGHMVYNLIDSNYFSRQEEDSIDDFRGGYDFTHAFVQPFLPQSAPSTPDR